MPVNWKDYPENWRSEIAPAIKDKANWCCQVCGRRCKRPSETWEGFMKLYVQSGGFIKDFKKGHHILTVAHLNHTPMDCRKENLRAMCAPCHLKYDKEHHARTRKKNNAKKGSSDSFRRRRSKRRGNQRKSEDKSSDRDRKGSQKPKSIKEDD